MNQEKQKLVDELTKILESTKKLSNSDRNTLISVREELKKSTTKNQISKALVPLLKLLHFAKDIIELLSSSG